MGHYTNTPEDNLLGITNQALLNEAKAQGFAFAELRFAEVEYPLHISAGLLLDFHRDALAQLYDWAGQWRRTNPNVGAFLPPPYPQISSLIAQFTEELNHRLQRPTTDATEIARLLAWAHHRLVWIHPFTNGNGRMARLLTNLLAYSFGYGPVELYQRTTSDARAHYLQAIRAADTFDLQPPEALIRPQLQPLA